MMINPGPSDASAIFALLTAISTPEAAKASLQDILKATKDYQTLVETSQADLKKAKDDLDAQKIDVEDKLSKLAQQQSEFDISFNIKSRELKALEIDLSNRKVAISAFEENLRRLNSESKFREKEVSDREAIISAKEDTASKITEEARAIRSEYEDKLSSLRLIIN